ncbi:adenylate cyclase domain protein [Mycobacterium xenopi 3993]|nr:adenylate cyclase domain protein [Mycobacterium xenopi 3993]
MEMERKFDVVDSTVPPSFDGIAAVTRVEKLPAQTLEAVYFDTPVMTWRSRGSRCAGARVGRTTVGI